MRALIFNPARFTPKKTSIDDIAIIICTCCAFTASGKTTFIIYSAPISATPARDAALEIKIIQFTANAIEG